MKPKYVVPCVCIDHEPGVSDSVRFGMPRLDVVQSDYPNEQFWFVSCPFCGGVAVLRTNVLLYDMVRAQCTRCEAETKVVCADGNLESVCTAIVTACALWNMRSQSEDKKI